MSYTPQTENVRLGYSYSQALPKGRRHHQPSMAEFDRWYAEEIRKAKEEAWYECDQETLTHIETNGTQTENWPENPYRKKQDD